MCNIACVTRYDHDDGIHDNLIITGKKIITCKCSFFLRQDQFFPLNVLNKVCMYGCTCSVHIHLCYEDTPLLLY